MSNHEGTKIYVVCVKEEDRHTEESVLRKCDICFDSVWCMPFNLLKIPLCMDCALKLPDPKFFLDHENFEAAIEELKKKTRTIEVKGQD